MDVLLFRHIEDKAADLGCPSVFRAAAMIVETGSFAPLLPRSRHQNAAQRGEMPDVSQDISRRCAASIVS